MLSSVRAVVSPERIIMINPLMIIKKRHAVAIKKGFLESRFKFFGTSSIYCIIRLKCHNCAGNDHIERFIHSKQGNFCDMVGGFKCFMGNPMRFVSNNES